MSREEFSHRQTLTCHLSLTDTHGPASLSLSLPRRRLLACIPSSLHVALTSRMHVACCQDLHSLSRLDILFCSSKPGPYLPIERPRYTGKTIVNLCHECRCYLYFLWLFNNFPARSASFSVPGTLKLHALVKSCFDRISAEHVFEESSRVGGKPRGRGVKLPRPSRPRRAYGAAMDTQKEVRLVLDELCIRLSGRAQPGQLEQQNIDGARHPSRALRLPDQRAGRGDALVPLLL